MDTIQHKVISLVESLSARFPSMSFTYGYDAAAQQHLVEVEPDTMYYSEAYMLAEGDVYSAWDAAHLDQDLVFVSNNPYHRVQHPLHTIVGALDILTGESIELTPNPLLVYSEEAPHPTMQAAELYDQLTSNGAKVVFGRGAVQQVITINNGEVGQMEAGEYNYAMAA